MSGTSSVKRVAGVAGDSMSPQAQKTRATVEAKSKKGHFYESLPKEFRREGFQYRQIARESGAAIYEQKWSGCCEPGVCYEVVRIRRREGFEIGGRWVPPAEIYPNSEAWGVDGWTVQDKNAAFRKLREIIAASNAFARFERKGVGR